MIITFNQTLCLIVQKSRKWKKFTDRKLPHSPSGELHGQAYRNSIRVFLADFLAFGSPFFKRMFFFIFPLHNCTLTRSFYFFRRNPKRKTTLFLPPKQTQNGAEYVFPGWSRDVVFRWRSQVDLYLAMHEPEVKSKRKQDSFKMKIDWQRPKNWFFLQNWAQFDILGCIDKMLKVSVLLNPDFPFNRANPSWGFALPNPAPPSLHPIFLQ